MVEALRRTARAGSAAVWRRALCLESGTGSVAGQEPADYGELSADLAATWLNSFVLARRAVCVPASRVNTAIGAACRCCCCPRPHQLQTESLHVHTIFWQRAKEYVRSGGVLYASINGETAIPDMEELFGVDC